MATTKYDKHTRERVRSLIKTMYFTHSSEQIAKELKAAGFKRPDGREVTPNFVCTVANTIGLVKFARTRKRPEVRSISKQTQPALPIQRVQGVQDDRALIELVIDSNLDKNKKIQLLSTLLT